MPSMLNAERKLLVMLVYTLTISFMVAGVFLLSIFNGEDFIYLTLKFILVSLVPLCIFYKIDYFYSQDRQESDFVLTHLEWITHHYIMYLLLVLANHWLIRPFLDLAGIHFNFIFILMFAWLILRLLKGFNLMLSATNAPKSKINFTISKIKHFLNKRKQ